MAGSLGEAVLDLTGDDSKLQADVDKAGNNALKKMDQFGSKMRSVGMGMTAGITLPIVAGAAFAVNAASDMAESANAVNVVFGESAGVMHEFGKSAAENVGLAESEFNQLGAVTGSFLQNLGFDQAAAADETINLTERAADMASIFNTDVSSALGAIQSGLKGEFNPLEQFGVKMNAAAIEAKALEMGLATVTSNTWKIREAQMKASEAQDEYNKMVEWYGEETPETDKALIKLRLAQEALSKEMEGSIEPLSDNAKAQAALALLYEQTNKLQGDFKNTSDGLANSMRITKAQFTDAAANLGTQLLPYVLKAVQFFSDLIAKFQGLSPEQQKMILIFAGIAAAIGPILMIVGSLISAISAIIPIVTAVAGVLTFPLIAIIALVGAAIFLLYKAWTENWGGIREKVAAAIAYIRPLFQQFISNLVSLWQNVLLPAIQKVWAWMNSTLFPFLKALGTFLGAVFSLTLKSLAAIWQNVLWPAIKNFIEWADKHIMPILRPIAEFFRNNLAGAIDWVTDAIKGATDWLNKMAEKLRKMTLPDWMTPGSPTPWEIGLVGVNDALRQVANIGLPGLSANLGMMPDSAMAGGMQLQAAGGSVQFVYQPMLSTADEYEASRVLGPFIEKKWRELNRR